VAESLVRTEDIGRTPGPGKRDDKLTNLGRIWEVFYTPEGLPLGIWLGGPFAVGVLAFYSYFTSGWITFSVAMIVACAAGVSGVLLGFIFGIPRYVASAKSRKYDVNTNLEQISDWLTKILVGLTLVEIGSWGPALGRLGSKVGSAMMNGQPAQTSGADVVALAIIVFYAIGGFLFMYLATRTRVLDTFIQEEQKLSKVLEPTVEEQKDAIRVLSQAGSGGNGARGHELSQR
jgi:hypothetical protein